MLRKTETLMNPSETGFLTAADAQAAVTGFNRGSIILEAANYLNGYFLPSQENSIPNRGDSTIITPEKQRAVSYTHLAVYKRQLLFW